MEHNKLGEKLPRSTKYLTLVGVRSVVVIDEFGHRSDTIEDMEELNARVLSVGEEIVKVVMDTEIRYTIRFKTTRGFSLEFRVGVNNVAPPTHVVRYVDVAIPVGVNASIDSPIEGIGLEWLRYDADGDGVFERVVQPTVEATGHLAQDITPPTISVSTQQQEKDVQVTISAKDEQSGVSRIWYSLDREQFQTYSSPFVVDPSQITTIYLFADDKVGNRTGLLEYHIESETLRSAFSLRRRLKERRKG